MPISQLRLPVSVVDLLFLILTSHILHNVGENHVEGYFNDEVEPK